MNKLVLSASLLFGLGAVNAAQAQTSALVNLFSAGVNLGLRAAKPPKLTAEQVAAQQANAAKAAATNATATATNANQVAQLAAAPQALVMHRTPADQLPKQAAAEITSLEDQLEQCHAAMLASPTGSVCTAGQRDAAVSVARAKPGWDLQPYQQEMAFYQAEDARRQQAASPAAPAK